MFQIVTGQSCKFDLLPDTDTDDGRDMVVWPSRHSLPSTDGIWLGHLVEKCWTCECEGTDEMATELRNIII